MEKPVQWLERGLWVGHRFKVSIGGLSVIILVWRHWMERGFGREGRTNANLCGVAGPSHTTFG